MLHPGHVLVGDDIEAAGGGDEDVGLLDHVVQGGDLVAVHRGLQRADRVHLGHHDPGALAAQRLGAALAHVAVAHDDRHLAADQHVGGAVDAVDERVPAAVLVVELALGHRVVDVDGREEQGASPVHLVEPVHAGGGLLGHALDAGGDPGPALAVLAERAVQQLEDDRVLLGVGGLDRRDRPGPLELGTLVNEQGGVAAVVEDHVGALPVRPGEHLLGAPPVLRQGLALPGVDRNSGRSLGGAVRADDDRRGGVVLGGEDVAGRPAHLRAERDQRLDQDGGLDGHVQGAGDPRAGERLRLGELAPDRHQAGHLVLGKLDLFTPELGERQIRHLEVAVGERARPGLGRRAAGGRREGAGHESSCRTMSAPTLHLTRVGDGHQARSADSARGGR
ncbi:hypothetical protein LUPAC06_02384 [Micromonospora saelicesensis]|nr:hypothetical protein LUPAC06_02384 [Micromonospora saelicesensis]